MNRGSAISTDFIMTIDTTKAGSASNTFILRCSNYGVYSAIIDWGDGSTSTITTYNDADLTHIYSVGGVYTVKISGHLPWIGFADTGDKLKVMSIENWGGNEWESFDNSFFGCSNMVVNALDVPNLSNLTYLSDGRLYRTFRGCTSISTISNFNQWDTSLIKFTVGMFMGCTGLTSLDMSNMDFSICTSFGSGTADSMFNGCTNLDIVNVTDMLINTSASVSVHSMFYNCGFFDLVGLDTWNISTINNYTSFLQLSTITTVEYDELLIAWDSQDAVNSLAVNFGSSKYTLASASATARAGLIANDLWTITDGGGI
ncbi:MAG: BspA family leucine-rich repeat surface protein [Candidatus Fonsibacter sp.]